jgi:hypothetical protein
MDELRFPIGAFKPAAQPDAEYRRAIIAEVETLAPRLRDMVRNAVPGRLHVPYRPGGWNVQQIVHHMADNDMNAYLRFKRALTEEEPLAASYREDLWAELADYQYAPVEESVALLELLHRRFVVLLRSLAPEDFSRKLKTQALGSVTLDIALQRFVWHNRHHMAQIERFLISATYS